jgi:hypothetical protein
MPVLLYATEACPMKKTDINSLDFVVNRFLFKLFQTNNRNVVEDCRQFFSFKIPSEIIPDKRKKFALKLLNANNILIRIFS